MAGGRGDIDESACGGEEARTTSTEAPADVNLCASFPIVVVLPPPARRAMSNEILYESQTLEILVFLSPLWQLKISRPRSWQRSGQLPRQQEEADPRRRVIQSEVLSWEIYDVPLTPTIRITPGFSGRLSSPLPAFESSSMIACLSLESTALQAYGGSAEQSGKMPNRRSNQTSPHINAPGTDVCARLQFSLLYPCADNVDDPQARARPEVCQRGAVSH